MISEYELEKMWKEAVVAYLRTITRYLLGGAQKSHEKHQPR
jgi:hypothetical protein